MRNPLRRLLTKWRSKGIRPVRTRQGIKYTNPLNAGRHPFQTYLHVLAVVSGTLLVISFFVPGWDATPASIEMAMPIAAQLFWGFTVLIGSATALTGSYWQGDYANALTIERIGLAIAGGSAFIYAAAILWAIGWPGVVPASITFGFGAACITRARDIGFIIQTALKTLRNGSADDSH